MQYVTNIIPSSHAGVLVDRVQVAGSVEQYFPGQRLPESYAPNVEEYRRGGQVLYRHIHGLAIVRWEDGQGREIEEPPIIPLPRFYDMFGGEEFCILEQ